MHLATLFILLSLGAYLRSLMATPPGFEPGRTESKSVVLPLHYGAMNKSLLFPISIIIKHIFRKVIAVSDFQ